MCLLLSVQFSLVDGRRRRRHRRHTLVSFRLFEFGTQKIHFILGYDDDADDDDDDNDGDAVDFYGNNNTSSSRSCKNSVNNSNHDLIHEKRNK